MIVLTQANVAVANAWVGVGGYVSSDHVAVAKVWWRGKPVNWAKKLKERKNVYLCC